MQLKTRDGISCDLCGTTYKSDFEYYSWDMRNISVRQDHVPPINQRRRQQVVFSVDVCPACFGDVSKRIIVNNEKIQSAERRRFIGTLDDLSGEVLTGTYEFYYVEISHVNVKMSGQPSVCVKCNKTTYDTEKECACGSKEFIVPADMKIDERVLELALSTKSYEELTNKAKTVRKVAGEWATKT